MSIALLLAPLRTSAQGDIDPSAWSAIHKEDIRHWSVKSGLPVGTIRELLKAIERDDTEDSGTPYTIQGIDARSLAKRGQIFVALTGLPTGHALAVYVVRSARPYQLVWQMEDLAPFGTCEGNSFATESVLGEAVGVVSSRGEIVVKMPTWDGTPDTNGKHGSFLLVATYSWNGKTYNLGGERRFDHYSAENGYKTTGLGIPLKCN